MPSPDFNLGVLSITTLEVHAAGLHVSRYEDGQGRLLRLILPFVVPYLMERFIDHSLTMLRLSLMSQSF